MIDGVMDVAPAGSADPHQFARRAGRHGAELVDRRASFVALCQEAQGCRRCAAMEGRRRVLGAANGRPGARVMFIGEAPGRRGGERTGVPFSGDRTGRNFTALLARAGLARDEVFITNAILCNPRDERGRNRAPRREELHACRSLLARQLALVDAPVVVPLGAVALAALDAIERHGLRLREAVGRGHRWAGRLLVPLYHPGPRAQLHRPFAVQCEDFVALGRIARDIGRRNLSGDRDV